MSHGVTGRPARTALDEDLDYRCIMIPRGSSFSQYSYLLHTNPKYISEPFTFRPERFLGPKDSPANRFLAPYGKGSRACSGINLANAELYLGIASLISGVKMELFETTEYDVTIVGEFFSERCQGIVKG